ncbi:MAG: MBL fold metallo-hydrolase [Candidatus Pacearchaeota archaeon]
MMSKVTENVLEFSFKEFGSNCYLIDKEIMIDASSIEAREELVGDFKENNLKFENVKIVLLTHLHYDHVGNLALFPKAKIYASKKEIEDFKKNKMNFLRYQDSRLTNELNKVKFFNIGEFKNKDFKIIEVPGHSRGSLAFLYKNILFSGDTIFARDGSSIGRTDLKTSVPEKMYESVKKLLNLRFDVLCPGH